MLQNIHIYELESNNHNVGQLYINTNIWHDAVMIMINAWGPIF